MIEPYKSKLITNIKKTKGLLETIQKMIESERYCMDIAQQIKAAEGLLKSSSNIILKSHLNSCAAHKLSSNDYQEKEQFIEDLIKVFNISKN